MAIVSLCYSAHPIPAHFSKLGFHQYPIRRLDSSSSSVNSLSLSSSILRFKNASGLLMAKRLPLIHALNKPSGGPKDNTEAITNADTTTAQGPPFLTIFAGVFVFALLLWAVWSLVSWLIGLLGLVFFK